jgi:hypothetical protein
MKSLNKRDGCDDIYSGEQGSEQVWLRVEEKKSRGKKRAKPKKTVIQMNDRTRTYLP